MNIFLISYIISFFTQMSIIISSHYFKQKTQYIVFLGVKFPQHLADIIIRQKDLVLILYHCNYVYWKFVPS